MSAPEEIAPGVYGVNLGFVNAFVLVDDEVTAIDTGIPKKYEDVSGAIRSLGRDLTNIALTHYHLDHIGNVPRLADGGRRVFVHSLDADVVRGDRKEPPLNARFPLKLVLTVLRAILFGSAPAGARVDEEIAHGDEIPGTGGLRAVHTPGHTPGHVSFIHPGKRVLFVGDAAQNRRTLGLPPPFGTQDMDEAKRSMRKIAELDFDIAVFGHGGVLRGKANTEFRKLADKLGA